MPKQSTVMTAIDNIPCSINAKTQYSTGTQAEQKKNNEGNGKIGIVEVVLGMRR